MFKILFNNNKIYRIVKNEVILEVIFDRENLKYIIRKVKTMEYTFIVMGHPNISSKHKTTLEFTKDHDIGKTADCIIGVRSPGFNG